MVKINENDYAYASARTRAVEVKLLESSRYSRMLDAATAEEAFKVLAEAEYGFGDSNIGNVFDFEELLSEEMKKCYLLLTEMAPQVEVIKAFQWRHDYFNVKVILKAEFSNQEVPPILMDTGTIAKETMKQRIREREYGDLSPIMRTAIEETHDVFSRTQDPQVVDLLLDKASYHQLVTDLNEIDSPFMQKLAEIMVDITNIKMYIRARTLNKAWNFLKKLLLEGGSISERVYFENSDKSMDAFVDSIRFSRYGDAVQNGWEIFRAKKNISGLERLLDDYMMEFVKQAKMVTMGVEPLVAYLFAKEAEIRNVRIILTGKINKLPADLIRERLRLTYV